MKIHNYNKTWEIKKQIAEKRVRLDTLVANFGNLEYFLSANGLTKKVEIYHKGAVYKFKHVRRISAH